MKMRASFSVMGFIHEGCFFGYGKQEGAAFNIICEAIVVSIWLQRVTTVTVNRYAIVQEIAIGIRNQRSV